MQRKLTVIFSADVVGYSSLMERDELGTLARLKENRKALFDPCVAAHGGRVFKLMGDGALIEFPSAASAVVCALELQRGMETGEGHAPEKERLRYRIGINLGDVIIEGDDIYGEGVNVAARIQALAPVGGIAVSNKVREEVSGKVAAEFEDLGHQTVKNIERPVHVFGVRSTSAARSPEKSERSRVSICVLPFTNMSGDLEQEYFSDGISEDIITDLSKVSALSVTARNSAFMFKGKHVDVRQVAKDLNVAHVLEGSVRKSGNRVRITAQLIDGKSGDHVWAERYDRDLADIFAVQDEISEAIVKAMKVKLVTQERKAIGRRGTHNSEAYEHFLMARQMWASGRGGHSRYNGIIRLCQKAIDLDPNYAEPWALMARTQGNLFRHAGQGESGIEAAQRAVALGPNLAEAHAALSSALRCLGRNEESMAEAELAYRLDPESYEAIKSLAAVLYDARRHQDAIPLYQKATDLMESEYTMPSMVASCYSAIGDTHRARQAAEVAVARVEKVLADEPENGLAMGFIVLSLAGLGERDRAKAWIGRGLLLNPEDPIMRSNFVCGFALLKDFDSALDLLEPLLVRADDETLNWAKTDSDLDALRDQPRFVAMIAAAEARLAAAGPEKEP